MDSFRAVIAAWPTLEDFAADAGAEANTAKQWRTRDRIPDECWQGIVEGATRRGIEGVTEAVLVALAATKRRPTAIKAA